MHYAEEEKSTSTARLADLLLPRSKIYLYAKLGQKLDTTDLVEPGSQPLLLFPEESAPELTSAFLARFDRPITLIVPDGTWKQARKLTHRMVELRTLPRVRLPLSAQSRYRLRRNQTVGGVCTIEAIAQALGVIDGVEVQSQLEHFLDIMVDRVLWSRRTSKLWTDPGVLAAGPSIA